MTKRIIAILILLPVAIIIVALALANRQPITLAVPNLDGSVLLSTELPLYAILFAVLFIGMIIGSLGTWVRQSRHRKAARANSAEASKAGAEAHKQRERADDLANDKATTPDNRPAVNARAAALGLPAPTPRKAA